MSKDASTARFLMNLESARASWPKAVAALYAEARGCDNQIFSRAGIDALCDNLERAAALTRNKPTIRRPDWYMYEKYDLSPSVNIGDVAYLSFIEIKGEYKGN